MTEPQSPGEKGSLTFFAAWLLLHEKADDWIRDALRRARETPEAVRTDYHRFLVSVEQEKEALKSLAADALKNEFRHLGFVDREEAEGLRSEVEDLRRRLQGFEEKLERAARGGSG